MRRPGSVEAVVSCLGLAACMQAGEAAPAPEGANPCPTPEVAPSKDPGADPVCTCPSTSTDPGGGADGGGPTYEASVVQADDAGSNTGEGGTDVVGLLALLGGSVRSDPNPVLCPSPLSCQSFSGFPACMAQGALSPPGCQTNADCTAAGMPAVPCISVSIDVAGAISLPLPVCLQLCNSP